MKKALSLALMLLACAPFFAQSAPKVLSAKDVDAFVGNFDKIDAELQALGDKFDNLFEGSDASAPGAMSAAIHQTKAPAEVAAILKKYGLGDNGFEKIMVIAVGFSALEAEAVIKAQRDEAGNDPSVASYFDQSLAQIAEMKKAIHKDDLALIEARRDALRAIMEKTGEESEE